MCGGASGVRKSGGSLTNKEAKPSRMNERCRWLREKSDLFIKRTGCEFSQDVRARGCVCVCVCAFVCPESFTEASAVCMRAAGQWMLSRNEWRPKQGRREADVREINIKPVNTNRHYLDAVLCMYASVMLLDVFFIFLWMNKGEDGVAACGAGVKSSQSLRMLMKQQIQRERGHVPTFP